MASVDVPDGSAREQPESAPEKEKSRSSKGRTALAVAFSALVLVAGVVLIVLGGGVGEESSTASSKIKFYESDSGTFEIKVSDNIAQKVTI